MRAVIGYGHTMMFGCLQYIGGVSIRPFLVADAAFPLSSTIIKRYDGDNHVGREKRINYSVIRTRRAVEQALGRLKGQWQVTAHSNLIIIQSS